MVPVGLKPSAKIAESLSVAGADRDARRPGVVLIVGLAGVIVTGSAARRL